MKVQSFIGWCSKIASSTLGTHWSRGCASSENSIKWHFRVFFYIGARRRSLAGGVWADLRKTAVLEFDSKALRGLVLWRKNRGVLKPANCGAGVARFDTSWRMDSTNYLCFWVWVGIFTHANLFFVIASVQKCTWLLMGLWSIRLSNEDFVFIKVRMSSCILGVLEIKGCD